MQSDAAMRMADLTKCPVSGDCHSSVNKSQAPEEQSSIIRNNSLKMI